MIEKLVGEPLGKDASLEISISQGSEANRKEPSSLSLPSRFNIYEGISEKDADEIASGVVRETSHRHFGIDPE